MPPPVPKPHPYPSPASHTMSSTITSSSSDTPPAHSHSHSHSPSPFHSFSAPTRWTPPPPRHSRSSRPSSSLSSAHPYSLPSPHHTPTPTPAPAPHILSPKSSSNLRPPASSAHAFSDLTRRHLSKLSVISPRESDVDSVLSEPVSYSTTSYVAADMWLVHKDVDNAERALVEREKHRERKRALHDHAKSVDVFSTIQDAQDVSSKLVRLFFAGGAREVPSAYGRKNGAGYPARDRDRDRDRGRADGADAWHGWEKGRPGWDRRAENVYDSFGGYNKRRRFEKVRRLRWWLRRVASRVRGDVD